MIDPQAQLTQTQPERTEDAPERLPWIAPRLDSVKFQDAQAGAISGGTTDGAGTHS